MNHPSQRSVIHPEDTSDMTYWAKKWGVSARQIIDAILDTGSLDPQRIKLQLREKNQLNNLFYRAFKFIKEWRKNRQQPFTASSQLRRIA
ncbi:MAG: hypothetical protein K0S33_635 [Bacteroidetes bacterium]|jgi:hypothetical protein|nr:hypothetical protein [Bacteroidota bacterium]